jgi:hypothetical protein
MVVVVSFTNHTVTVAVFVRIERKMTALWQEAAAATLDRVPVQSTGFLKCFSAWPMACTYKLLIWTVDVCTLSILPAKLINKIE